MAHFMGTHHGRLDAKKRISVPAPFRNVLKHHAEQGAVIVLSKSLYFSCLEVRPRPEFDSLANDLQRLERFSERRVSLEVSLFGESCEVEPDKEGRVVLPDEFTAYAALSDSVAFLGLGRSFQIWEPEAGRQHVAQSRERARTTHATLPVGAPA